MAYSSLCLLQLRFEIDEQDYKCPLHLPQLIDPEWLHLCLGLELVSDPTLELTGSPSDYEAHGKSAAKVFCCLFREELLKPGYPKFIETMLFL